MSASELGSSPQEISKPQKHLHFPSREKEILKFWKDKKIFKKSIDSRDPNQSKSFYDGPPFATGLPHFGNLLPSTLKDAFSRYFTMQGYQVKRRFGWDCHGVPVEMLIQKKLGLQTTQDMKVYGLGAFNQACRESVMAYTKEWKAYMERLGRWVDMDNPYRTMDPDYMEGVWTTFKKLWSQDLIYKGKRIINYSCALGCSLSNFEASLNYQSVQDPSLTLAFKLKDEEGSLLVWTTTPWSLPANVGIAVNPKEMYVKLRDKKSEQIFMILEKRVETYFKSKDEFTVLERQLGQEFIGKRYEPLFKVDALSSLLEKDRSLSDRLYRVQGADFVLTDTGTGMVHLAPCFGEDDFQVGRDQDLPLWDHLDDNGSYLKGFVPEEVVGTHFKGGEKQLIQYLKAHNRIFHYETFMHSYPMCYRSNTPLMFRAMPSWFLNIQKIKDKLKEVNQEIRWVPDHIKDGRFGQSLAQAPDWNLARTRFWGNPLPIWSQGDRQICFGSVQEIQDFLTLHKGKGAFLDDKKDLHPEFLTDIQIPSGEYEGTWVRESFVFDCWFESGSMPYAQNNPDFEKVFPADFICEGIDQTRGWFYTLNVISTALYGKPASQTIIVNGIILAKDGKKMSKSLQNYPDANLTFEQYGADALRLWLLSSPATTGEESRYSNESVPEMTRKILLPLWNACSFFQTYGHLEKFDPNEIKNKIVFTDLDQWMQAKMKVLINETHLHMENYAVAKVISILEQTLDDLNNWYIRRNRRRFWEGDPGAFKTLFQVLVDFIHVLAPFAPFAAEHFFHILKLTPELKAFESIHLCLLKKPSPLREEEKTLLERVSITRQVVEWGRSLRTTHNIKNRQPLSTLTVGCLNPEQRKHLESLKETLAEELNVKQVVIHSDPQTMAHLSLKPQFKVLGSVLGSHMKEFQDHLAQLDQAQVLDVIQKGEVLTKGTQGLVSIPLKHLDIQLKGKNDDLITGNAYLVVSLDPNLNDALRLEGLSRELVSQVQKSRRKADLAVEDRITLWCEVTDPLLKEAIMQHKAHIQKEVLATSLSIDGFEDQKAGFKETLVLEKGKEVKIQFLKQEV